jgi:hypothetical protein
VRQQRLPFGLGFGDQRSAVGATATRLSGHVVYEKRDTAGMAAVAHRQRAAVCAPKAMSGTSRPCRGNVWSGSDSTRPPLTTAGWKIGPNDAGGDVEVDLRVGAD